MLKLLTIAVAILVATVANATPFAAIFATALQGNPPQNQYTISIEGGEINPSSGSYDYQNYYQHPPGYSQNYHVSGQYDVFRGGIDSDPYLLDFSGELTVTLQWHGPNPAPKTVLIKEACFGYLFGPAYFEADNGLGDPLFTGDSGQLGLDWGAPPTWPPKPIPHLRAIKGGDTVTFKRNPYVAGIGGDFGVAAELYYALKIVTTSNSDWLELQGIEADGAGSERTIVGKRINATVQLPSGYSAPGPYAWSVPGALAEFKLEPSSLPGDEPVLNSLSGRTIPFAASSANIANWFWWAPGEKTINVTFPLSYQGQPLGDITLLRDIEVFTPLSTLTSNFTRSQAEYYKRFTNPNNPEQDDYPFEDTIASKRYYQATAPNDYAVTFSASVSEDPEGPTAGGEWIFVQMRSVNTTRSVVGTSLTRHESSGQNTFEPSWDTYQLDADWPYEPDPPPGTNFADPNYYNSPPSFPIGESAVTGDSPFVPLDIKENVPNPALVPLRLSTSYSVNDRYYMYILYRPSGTGSQWVPLRRIRWSFTASANRGSESNPWTKTNTVPPFNPTSKVGRDTDPIIIVTPLEQPAMPPPYPKWNYLYIKKNL